MANEAATLSLDAVIKQLSLLPVETGKPILSLYIQSHGQDLEQRKRVRVFLDQMLRSKQIQQLREINREWADKIKLLATEADHFLNDKDKTVFHGIAFFATWSQPEVIRYASYLPFPNSCQILDFPAMGPLVGQRDDYNPLCLCHFNQEEAHVLEIQHGQLQAEYAMGQENYPHHKQGGWSQSRFQRKHDEGMEQFFRKIANQLDQLAIHNPQLNFALLGQKKEIPLLDKYLSDQVLKRVINRETSSNGLSTGQLLRRGIEMLEKHERQREREDMARLSLGRISQGFGSVSPDKVFRAVNEGQVETLLVRENLEEAGAIDLATHTILDEYSNRSPYGGRGEVSIGPLREMLVYETVRRKGRIQWLPPSPANGETPAYGVLYRNRNRVEYAGN